MEYLLGGFYLSMLVGSLYFWVMSPDQVETDRDRWKMS